MKHIYTWAILSLLLGCLSNASNNDKVVTGATTQRPKLHFTPPQGWMNDPNGMVYHNGLYHLFYQHNPDDIVWGPMHWGHATSEDLVNWQHRPIALLPDQHGTIFSGSVVLDKNNTSGLGTLAKPPLIAMYTYHNSEREKAGHIDFQTQGIAFSLDDGKSWQKHKANPILTNPGKRVFRDPKVSWHEPSQQWVMVLTLGNSIGFYTSPNLLDWRFQSEFGQGLGAHGGVWECPDLIRMQLPGSDEYRYVLIVSLVPGGPNGGSGTQYFVGHFDGSRFELDKHDADALKPIPAHWPAGQDFENFESGYHQWLVYGEAFAEQPAKGAFPGQNRVAGFTDRKLVNSFYGGDQSTGRMESDVFVINQPYLNFKIGGGSSPDTALQLWVEGELLASKSGADSERLEPASWDVSQYQGKQAKLVIVDKASGSWGHILVDDIRFSSEPAMPIKERALWLDYGPDNYAGVTYSNYLTEQGNPVFINWVNNWLYANDIPASDYRGAMSLPRELFLYLEQGELRLGNRPVPIISRQFEVLNSEEDITLNNNSKIYGLPSQNSTFKLSFTASLGSAKSMAVNLLNHEGERLEIAIEAANEVLTVNRKASQNQSFHDFFSQNIIASYPDDGGRVTVDIIYDHGIVEIFVNDGKTTLTIQAFPANDYEQFSVMSNGQVTLEVLKVLRHQTTL